MAMLIRDGVNVRPPGKNDADAVARLIGELGYPATHDEAMAQVDAVQRFPNALVLVAEAGADVQGLITCHIFPSIHSATPIAWITTLVVSNDARGMGIGTMLLNEAERWASDNGAERVSLTSGAHRVDAHEFYQGKGYAQTGVRFAKNLEEKTV